MLKYLSEHKTEINFLTICSKLKVDYQEAFLPALDAVPDFRRAIVNHLENLKFYIIECINNRVLGLNTDSMPLPHAKFMLDLIDNMGILPRLKAESREGGGKKVFEMSDSLKHRLKIDRNVNDKAYRKSLAHNETKQNIEDELKEMEERKSLNKLLKDQEDLENGVITEPVSGEWDLPDKF